MTGGCLTGFTMRNSAQICWHSGERLVFQLSSVGLLSAWNFVHVDIITKLEMQKGLLSSGKKQHLPLLKVFNVINCGFLTY